MLELIFNYFSGNNNNIHHVSITKYYGKCDALGTLQ